MSLRIAPPLTWTFADDLRSGVGVTGAYKCDTNVTQPMSYNFSDPNILQLYYEAYAQLAADCNNQYGTAN